MLAASKAEVDELAPATSPDGVVFTFSPRFNFSASSLRFLVAASSAANIPQAGMQDEIAVQFLFSIK
jgi:hypothetical protein